MRSFKWYAILFVFCLIILIFHFTFVESPAQEREVNKVEKPEEIIEYLLNLPHGFAKLSPNDRNFLAKVVSSPEEYIPIIEEKMRLPENSAKLSDQEFRLRYERAISLLAKIGNDEAKRVLWESHEESYNRLSAFEPSAPQRRPNGFLLSTQRLILDALGELGDTALVENTLSRIEEADSATQFVMLRYVGLVSIGDPKVKEALKKIANNKSSSLYQERVLLQTIEKVGAQNKK